MMFPSASPWIWYAVSAIALVSAIAVWNWPIRMTWWWHSLASTSPLKALKELITNERELKNQLELVRIKANVYEGQRDEYKRQAEDKEEKLSDCRGRNEALWKDYGKAVLWKQGRNWKSRELSVAVQHVRVEDTELAKQIRGLLAVHLQGDSYSKENHTVEHILIPFENPSCTRVVLFSDSEVGIEVQDTFNRYRLINEKMAHLEKGFAGGEVPEVDIAIVVFPSDSSADFR